MQKLIDLYRNILHLRDATFIRIEHEDAMVAIVFKVTQPKNEPLILKIFSNGNDYLREVYFLNNFANTLPVPRIVGLVEPESVIQGGILMDCLPGYVLKKSDLKQELVYQIGNLLGLIHLHGASGFGDCTQPDDLRSDPIFHFNKKFEEGFSECSNHLSKTLLEKCRLYYDAHLHLLSSRNKSCIVHRDFRPGNIIVHEGKIQGIIDWAGGRASFSEEDFCPLEMEEWSSDIIFKQAFLAGYANIRPVPDYDDIMPLLRLNRAIAVIGFTVKRNTWNGSHAKVYQFNRAILDELLDSFTY